MDRQVVESIGGWKDGLMEGLEMAGWVYGQISRWQDGQVEELVAAMMDRWKDDQNEWSEDSKAGWRQTQRKIKKIKWYEFGRI